MKDTLSHTPEVSRQVGEVAASVAGLLHRYDTVAYVLGIRQGRTIRGWAERGTVPADPRTEMRLRVTEQLALTVKDEVRPWVSGAWLISANPHLGEQSPAELIRSLEGATEDEQTIGRLQAAADHFAALATTMS